MNFQQRKELTTILDNMLGYVKDLDKLILTLIESRDLYVLDSNAWILANSKVNLIEAYKDIVVKESVKLKKFI